MDIKDVKEHIINNQSLIVTILESIGCDRIFDNGKEYRCAKNSQDTNNTRVSVNKETLFTRCYDTGETFRGDILSFVMVIKDIDLFNTLKFVSKTIGINYNNSYSEPIKAKSIFDDYLNLISNKSIQIEVDEPLEIKDDSILQRFESKPNIQFFNDGISKEIQLFFEVSFCYQTNKIIVPWRDIDGRLVGIMTRENHSAEYCDENNLAKWHPLYKYNFSKSKVLFGLDKIYKPIQLFGAMFVAESEKATMQSVSFGIPYTVGVGGHELSPYHKRIIEGCHVTPILAYDNDIDDDFKCSQLVSFNSKSIFFKTEYGFIKQTDLLGDKSEKNSPFDLGLDVFLALPMILITMQGKLLELTVKEFIDRQNKKNGVC